MLEILTPHSFRYVLSFAVSSGKIVNALRNFCTACSHGGITSVIDTDLLSSASIEGSPYFSMLNDMLLATSESVKESVDWSYIRTKPVFISNLKELMQSSLQNKRVTEIVNKFRLFRTWVAVLFFVGIFAAIAEIVLTRSISVCLFVNIIWMLCCLSLYVTTKLIIKDWTKSINVRGKKKRESV